MLETSSPHLGPTIDEAVLAEALSGLDVADGAQKSLSPWLFYDAEGSRLFEQITELPEYYLTRTERSIFAQIAPSLPLHLGMPVSIAELGAGSANKTGVLLREFAAHQLSVLYQPIDISSTALDEAVVALQSIAGVRVAPQVANYITETFRVERPKGHNILALYIGSSIGNFSPHQAVSILRNLHAHLERGDNLLLGVDLAPSPQKSVETLLAAYDDAAGVTAAFNLNILVRLNRELAANFVPDCFRHRVKWNAAESRIEMHLESTRAQTVQVAGREIHFRAGETIHTENSNKFTETSLRALLAASGFAVDVIITDPQKLFAVTLAYTK